MRAHELELQYHDHPRQKAKREEERGRAEERASGPRISKFRNPAARHGSQRAAAGWLKNEQMADHNDVESRAAAVLLNCTRATYLQHSYS